VASGWWESPGRRADTASTTLACGVCIIIYLTIIIIILLVILTKVKELVEIIIKIIITAQTAKWPEIGVRHPRLHDYNEERGCVDESNRALRHTDRYGIVESYES